jgi:hypothetical protein
VSFILPSALPAFFAGQLVPAADLQALVDDITALAAPYKFKAADESVTSSITLQDDNHFSWSILANTNYMMLGWIYATGAAAGDIKMALSAPAGCTGYRNVHWAGAAVTTPSSTIPDQGVQTNIASRDTRGLPGGDISGQIWGAVFNAGTAGTLKFQWAQDVSNATPTTIKKGSWMLLIPVS